MQYYDLPASPNSRRVRIFLAEKKIELPTTTVDMTKGENKTEAYLSKNPLGKMPLLELDDGRCIAESGAICRYLEEIHPEPKLYGEDAEERGIVEMWNRRAEFEILLPMMSIFVNTHPMWKGQLQQVPEWADICRKNVTARMNWLDQELNGREYLAGDRYTVADIVAQCGFIMGKAALQLPIPEGLTNLNAWFARGSVRPTARA